MMFIISVSDESQGEEVKIVLPNYVFFPTGPVQLMLLLLSKSSRREDKVYYLNVYK